MLCTDGQQLLRQVLHPEASRKVCHLRAQGGWVRKIPVFVGMARHLSSPRNPYSHVLPEPGAPGHLLLLL